MIEGWASATDSERIACGEARDAGQSQKQRIESRWWIDSVRLSAAAAT
jgi:hypothetical protein